jgi:hypothetical protein
VKPGFGWTPLEEVSTLQPHSSVPLIQDQPVAINSVGDVAIAPGGDFGILNVDLGDFSSPGLAEGKGLFSDPGIADEDLIDIFTGEPFQSATILDQNYYDDLQFNDATPTEFQDKDVSRCVDSVSYVCLLLYVVTHFVLVLFFFFLNPPD